MVSAVRALGGLGLAACVLSASWALLWGGVHGYAAARERIEGQLDAVLTTLRRHEVALKAGAIGAWGNEPAAAREGAL